MAVSLNKAITEVMKEVVKADNARSNRRLPTRFSSMREMMLMLNGEWFSLQTTVRSGRTKEINEAAVVAKLLRTAAVCVKAACDISTSKTTEKALELLEKEKEPDFGYISVVRPVE